MDDDMYDEFGNYIGPDLDMRSDSDNKSNEDSDSARGQNQEEEKWMNDLKDLKNQAGSSPLPEDEDEEYYKKGYQVVLHEDKQYYPEAEQVYGPGVEALVMDEDAQPLTQPIIEPPKDKSFQFYEKEIPQTTYDLEYLSGLSTKPAFIRNVVICGHLHHGKTLLCDMLLQSTHKKNWDLKKKYKWTDNRKDEIDRNLSIKCSPLTLVLQDQNGKSFLFNFMDTPGHTNFSDEVTVGMRLADGALIVVDVIEGVTFYVERLIKEALRNQLEIVIVLNKMDRLVLELKLPVNDAYHKIKHTLDEINFVIQTFQFKLNKESTEGRYEFFQQQISPVNGNVVFASTEFGACFTLDSFAIKYQNILLNNQENYQSHTSYKKHSQELKQNKSTIDPKKFSKFLWGDLFYNEETRKFERKSQGRLPRSFVHFVLEPFYKIVSHTISQEKNELMPIMKKLGIFLKKKDYQLDIRPLLKLVLGKIFGDISCLTDSMVTHLKNSFKGNQVKIDNQYRNQNDDQEIVKTLKKCDSKGPLCVNILKLFNNESQGNFYSYGRIMSGTLKKGDEVKVLGEGYTIEDEEDMVIKTVQRLWIMQAGGRYKIEVDMMTAGNWILIEGIDQTITKTATLISAKSNQEIDIFKPLDFNVQAAVKVACEPLNPSELPKMLEGLRKINKSYPLSRTKVEETGEHVVFGTGELYMDSIFHDLRKIYSEIEIKVSEPFVQFNETVIEASSVACFAETPNKKNQINMIAEPLDKGLAEYIDAGLFDLLPNMLVNEFSWDELTAQSVWAFGPQKRGTNMLIDYTLSNETDKQKLYQMKESLVQGFQWATREGPLCEEPIKNVKFKILSGEFANEPIYRSGSQIIPTMRRVAYSSFLLASPRVMEPIYVGEVYCPQDTIEAIYNVLIRRRAHVTQEEPKPGSPLYTLKVELPGIESFGFETDLRTHTLGQAMVLTAFSHWAVVPGDPLDKSIQLRPLEPSPVPHLAREFMVKTRRRKGLLEDVSIAKFFDNAQMLEMAKQDPSLHSYF